MEVGIVAQRSNPQAASLAREIVARLAEDDIAAVVDEVTADRLDDATGVPVERMAECDLVVSIGGDGTFLYAARGAGTTPIMGVNLGEVGFLNAVSPADAVSTVAAEVERLRAGTAIGTRTMDRVRAESESWTLPPAINEIAILGPQRGHGNGIDVTVTVDGEDYTGGHVDGVLVATPTGSTAYNLSEGGPLVHPDVGGLVVTKMAGEDGMPPLIVDRDATVTVRIADAERAHVVSDGRVEEAVTPPERVRVARAGEPVTVAGPALDFYGGLGKLD
ncbi:NAD(+)/NADH kinase [Halorientalis marina]|jgi:NAD+ kinase|uniref:NAD(+)/NADH kinase n=1 Tax=Halorientalis marina TaxID=2931976 RepID=UPI001FF67B9E|nr:NAD(+)/NADH kinase [Halorientalis marina]